MLREGGAPRGGGLVLGAPPSPGWPRASDRSWPRSPSTTAPLRQVTRDDVTGWLDGRKHQANDASALRDLFRTLKSERLVFTNPTDRVRVVKPNQTTPNPGSAPKHCN